MTLHLCILSLQKNASNLELGFPPPKIEEVDYVNVSFT